MPYSVDSIALLSSALNVPRLTFTCLREKYSQTCNPPEGAPSLNSHNPMLAARRARQSTSSARYALSAIT
eukprot:88603-Pyramimonas_sp.AAC.1